MRQCCTRHSIGPPPADPCRGVATPLPAVTHWRSNPELAKIRRDQLNLKVGNKDTGSNGAVHLVQLTLRHWGCRAKKDRSLLLPVYGPDGSYGSETKTAVIASQNENKDANQQPLAPDGIVGSSLIGVTVDLVRFPDGHGDGRIGRILHEANYVLNRVGIAIRLGTTLGPHDSGSKACTIFEKNKSHSRKGWCRSEVMAKSIDHVTD